MRPGRKKYGTVCPEWNVWAPRAPTGDIPEALLGRFSELLSASLATNTWKSLDSVTRSVESIAQEFALDLSMPWDSSKLLSFILGGSVRGWRASTLRSYASRVSSLHQLLGLGQVPISPWARRMLVGLENSEATKPNKLAVTPFYMRMIREQLVKADWTRQRKRIFWATCCLLFSGSLRSAELLPGLATSWTPETTLLGRDIVLRKEKINGAWVSYLQLSVKVPKESKNSKQKIVPVELFEQKEAAAWFCPLRAFTSCLRVVHAGHLDPDLPVFRTANGLGYCPRRFNEDIKLLLSDKLNYQAGGGISAHCFRAGIASTLARMGFSEETIAAQGRWSSACYQRLNSVVNYRLFPNALI